MIAPGSAEPGSATGGRHRIWRQVLHIEVADEAMAWQLRSGPELRRLQEERLLPILDRCLSELCPADRLLRIDSLTVELGAVDLDNLEQDLAAELECRLPEALAERLRQDDARTAGRSERGEVETHLELLAFFAATGRAPWWADATRPDLVAAALTFLIDHAPRPLAALIRRLARQDPAAPNAPQNALLRLVMAVGDDELAALAKVVGGSSTATRLPEITDLLQRVMPAFATPEPERFRHAVWQAVLVTTSRDPGMVGDIASFWRRVLARTALASGRRYADLRTALQRAGTAASDPWHEVERALAEESPRRPSAAVKAPSVEAVDELPDLTSSDADGVAIETCGLVLLWPFLGTFFERLGLAQDGRFQTPEARHRAVGLLHHLATEELLPVEYQVVLPKVLCGVELEEVFDFGPPITDDEAEACRDLLRAVIAHAEILNEMSLPGFRGTFLLRRGVLRPQGGAWLLRVERETYDVVLDRFPWGVGWVKLGWMDVPLQVEW